MSNKRLPTIAELERNALNAAGIITAWHRDVQAEIDGLEDDCMWFSDGRSRVHHLKLAKARMTRVRALAEHFKVWLPEQEAMPSA